MRNKPMQIARRLVARWRQQPPRMRAGQTLELEVPTSAHGSWFDARLKSSAKPSCHSNCDCQIRGSPQYLATKPPIAILHSNLHWR